MKYMYCAQCGETVLPDPAGSEGVYVHADSREVDGPDLDAHHVPVPETEGDFNLTRTPN